MRIDKWLWAARFFKTRSLASRACDLGRIGCNGHPAKPARGIQIGDRVHVRTPGGDFDIEVLGLSELRGPASAARALYQETEESKELRLKQAEERKLSPAFPRARTGKPSKRDRRVLERLRNSHRAGLPPETEGTR